MEESSNFSAMAPLVFNGEDYNMWAVRMETYLDALDLWEAVEDDYAVDPLPTNPTMAQIKMQKERKIRKSKAKACLFAAVSSMIFTRIMSLTSAKAIWEYLKKEYAGDVRIRGMKVLNLIRDFELQKMKNEESVKDYTDRLLGIANKIRLLGTEFNDSRIVEKLLVTVPEKFEATITTLENTKELTSISLAELFNALQAQEQRRTLREERIVEGALAAKHQENTKFRTKKTWKNQQQTHGENSFNSQQKGRGSFKNDYPPCKHCGKKGHSPFKCWKRPDAECSSCKQLGHEAVICTVFCRSKKQQQDADAKAVEQEEEEELFVATCFTSKVSSECWLVDSGCTNHMTYDRELFKDMRATDIKRVRIGNGEHLTVEGIGTVVITSCGGTKTISDVLFVPEIDQNLISVGQLMEKGCSVLFENKQCCVKDAAGKDLMKIKMKGKNFAIDPMEEDQLAYKEQEFLRQTALISKRRRSSQDVEIEQNKRISQSPSEAKKDHSSEIQQLGGQNITSTTSKAGGKNAKHGFQASDSSKIHVWEQRGLANFTSTKKKKKKSSKRKHKRQSSPTKKARFSEFDSQPTQGLEYLHDTANPQNIYRNLKTWNILLEEEFNPKLFFVKEVLLSHCRSEEQVADTLTKPLALSKFEYFRMKLGMSTLS